jgi:hypothetical protein
MATIPSLSIDAPVEKMQTVLETAGCLVVTGAANDQTIAALRAEMAPHMAQATIATQDDPEEFYPGQTRRVSALVGRSEAARRLVMEPMVLALCDHFLLPDSKSCIVKKIRFRFFLYRVLTWYWQPCGR